MRTALRLWLRLHARTFLTVRSSSQTSSLRSAIRRARFNNMIRNSCRCFTVITIPVVQQVKVKVGICIALHREKLTPEALKWFRSAIAKVRYRKSPRDTRRTVKLKLTQTLVLTLTDTRGAGCPDPNARIQKFIHYMAIATFAIADLCDSGPLR